MKLLRNVFGKLRDPDRSYDERTYMMLSIIGVVAMIIAVIFDIIGGESLQEIFTIIGAIIAIPVIVTLSIRFNRIDVGSFVSVCTLVFGIIPVTFFFGGGTRGGGVFWIIFAYMFIGLSLSGALRIVMMAILTGIAVFEYWASYRHSDWINPPHTIKMNFMDALVSVLLVGICMYIMLMYQKSIFAEESKRAHQEAERAEELNRSQNRFFSSMSHEIRTPINSILGLNELILRDEQASDDIVRDAMGIQGSGKMLLSLINDILDFSKIEAGSMDIVPVDYRIGDMLSEVVNMIWIRAHEKGLEFEVIVDPDVPTMLYGDEVRIKQMIINLLNNAVKYTKEGHVELRVECGEIAGDQAEMRFSITDTGMGIKKEDLPYLFDAFKRVDEGKNRHIEGTGLGLSIVKQLAELMNGSVTVNSFYGEGSTFTVTLKQTVSDRNPVGDLNIHNQQIANRSTYESSFLAPEARILIVDDNEMNLEVEKRLLKDTDMAIDTAISGKEALEKALQMHYDAIFMDHLMPGIDGIECLGRLRDQDGGLNRTTPVIVLTANAGSENRELYTRSGFDGYLVKPVSGEAMEDACIRHISREKIILRSVMMGDDEEIDASEKFTERASVIITASSMCDLPDSVVRKLRIPIIPCRIKTENGVFEDGVSMDAYEMIRLMNSGKEAVSDPPDEAEYTEFFADALKKAHHVIHIAITSGMSAEYVRASEAAKSFDNVTVINSECLSSATGILVLIACKLAQQGISAEDIISELNAVKHRLQCSFIIERTDFMAKKGHVSRRLNRIADELSLHPEIRIRNDRKALGGIWFGRTKRAYGKYIRKALPPDTIPDSDIAFVTYVDLSGDMLEWIEKEIRKTAYFEHVVFTQASAAISSNCGPGTFGILYFVKSDKSYNIASYIDAVSEFGEGPESEDAAEYDAAKKEDPVKEPVLAEKASLPEKKEAKREEKKEEKKEEKEPEDRGNDPKIGCIDMDQAIKNSGSEGAFRAVLEIFRNSIPEKHADLEKFFSAEDWENYKIKIHALKSSAKLVGALHLGKEAESLETAAKENDITYIRENHERVMEEYLTVGEEINSVFGEAAEEKPQKPVADDFMMESVYEELKSGAEDMDCDRIGAIMKEIAEYEIPDSEKDRFERVREKAERFDYDGILEALNTEG